MKTDGVTTKSGVSIEIVGLARAFRGISKSLIADNDWTVLSVSFATPAHSQGGMIRVRRHRTDKLDRFISGTVWLDNVRITEAGKWPSNSSVGEQSKTTPYEESHLE